MISLSAHTGIVASLCCHPTSAQLKAEMVDANVGVAGSSVDVVELLVVVDSGTGDDELEVVAFVVGDDVAAPVDVCGGGDDDVEEDVVVA